MLELDRTSVRRVAARATLVLGLFGVACGDDFPVDDEQSEAQWRLVGDDTVAEGDFARYAIALEGATLAAGETVGFGVQVTSAGANGATAGDDYTFLRETITITGPRSAATFTVQAVADAKLEPAEAFEVAFEVAAVGEIPSGDGSLETSIVDSTTPQWFISGDRGVAEGAVASYQITLGGVELGDGQSLSIDVNTVDGGAASATEGVDYLSADGTTAVIVGPANSTTVTVATIVTTDFEDTEQFQVELSNPSVGVIASGGETIETSIVDQTETATWSLTGQASADEGSSAEYTVVVTGIELASGQTATINIETIDGVPVVATEARDYRSLDQTVVTITGPETSATISVQTLNDAVLEQAENFAVRVRSPSVGSVSLEAETVSTVIADQTNPADARWSITGDSDISEGVAANYTISLADVTLAPGVAASIDVDTEDGTVSTATEGTDYASLDGTTVTLTGPQASGAVTALAADDGVLENDESFQVVLSNPTIGSVAAGLGSVETTIPGTP